jgi:hypothetical protein
MRGYDIIFWDSRSGTPYYAAIYIGSTRLGIGRQPFRKIRLGKLIWARWEGFREVRGMGEGGRSIFRE